MGVHGLWRLIEPSGKPVPLETLENKVLAVDISIWLHQAIKGFQDSKGAPVPNAHLLGIFHRVCKLLYYRIQPVFVFDGAVPVLKRQTIARRNEQKSKVVNDATRLQKQLLNSLLKHSAINAVLSETVKANLENDLQKNTKNTRSENDMYMLPPAQFESTESGSDEETVSSSDHSNTTKHWDLHTIDAKSNDFKSLPANVRHEILSELKETRKQSSWGRIHELPTQSNDFAGYQMNRLLKRHSVQTSLEEATKEMGGHSLSLGELEALLTNHGVITSPSMANSRIASDENKRYIYIKNLKQAIDEASSASRNIEHEVDIDDHSGRETTINEEHKIIKSKADQDYAENLGQAIMLSLQEQATTSREISVVDNVENDDAVEVDISKASVEQKEKATKSLADQEYERDLEEAIKLSLQHEKIKLKNSSISNSSKFVNSIIPEEDEGHYSDSSDNISESESADKMLASAKSYMTEYSGLTPNEISKILNDNSVKSSRMFNAKLVQSLKRTSSSSHEGDTFEKSSLPNNSVRNTTQITDDISAKSDVPSSSEISNEKTISNNLETSSQTSNSVSSTLEASYANKLHGIKENVSLNPVEVMSDSDTSDDFLEVETAKEVPTLKCSDDKQSLKITIEKVTQLEDDDMFSDIFKDIPDNKASTKTSSLSHPPRLQNIHKAASNLSSAIRNIDTNTQLVETDSSKNRTENLAASTEKDDTKMQSKGTHDKVDDVIMLEDDAAGSNLSSTNDSSQRDSVLLKEILKPLAKKDRQKTTLTTSELNNMKDALAKESSQLMKEKSVKERLAGNITEQMCQEAQELLQLFGVPYIIAPMEAEAQCAFLNEIGLTDGTITDDSDIWLFGGKTVYKNFFNQSKLVLEFQAESIHHSFKLSRYEMILLALLVGSDYTTGIQGIGPVTALEILASFPPPQKESTANQARLLSGLQEFRKWFCNSKISKRVRSSLRSKLKNVEISEHFPSLQVVQAYLEPTVETSRDPFSWQKPDTDSLMEYARQKFGWSQTKSEEILKPVLKRLEEDPSLQTKITNYFKIKHKLQANNAEDKMSKRVKMAVTKMGTNGTNSDELSDENTKKKPTRKTKNGSTKDTVSTDTIPKVTKQSSRRTKKKSTKDEVQISKETQQSSRGNKNENNEDHVSNANNEDMVNDVQILKETKKLSRGKIKEMKIQMNEMLLRAEAMANPENVAAGSSTAHIYRKEIIHQREQQKADLLRNKLKAIEVFRKSKSGPGYLKKRQKVARQAKEDAELSEDSD